MSTSDLRVAILSDGGQLKKAFDKALSFKLTAYIAEYTKRVKIDADIDKLNEDLVNTLGPCWGIPEEKCRE